MLRKKTLIVRSLRLNGQRKTRRRFFRLAGLVQTQAILLRGFLSWRMLRALQAVVGKPLIVAMIINKMCVPVQSFNLRHGKRMLILKGLLVA